MDPNRPHHRTPPAIPQASSTVGPSRVQKTSVEHDHGTAKASRVNTIPGRADSICNHEPSFEEHGPVQVDMDILCGQIHESIYAGQNELRTKIHEEGLEGVPEHLLYTPPSSPMVLPESPPPSPQTKARQEWFKNMKYPNLINANNELRRHLRHLRSNGASKVIHTEYLKDDKRELWRNNASQYMASLTKIKGINKINSDLEDHNEAVRHARISIDVEVHAHSTRQLNLQIDRRQREINWLVENRELMKKVLERFRDLAEETGQSIGETEAFEQVKSSLQVSEEEFRYVGTNDITKFRWFKEKGLIHWLSRAHKDLVHYDEILQKRRESVDRDMDYCKAEIPKLKSSLKEMDDQTLREDVKARQNIEELQKRKTSTTNTEVELERNKRYDERLEEDRQWAMVRNKLRSYNTKLDDLVIFLRAWTEEQKGINLVIQQVFDLINATKIIPDVMQHHSALVNDLYRICYTIHHRHKVELRLRAIYQSKLLSSDQFDNIHKLLGRHLAAYIDDTRDERWERRRGKLDDEAVAFERELFDNEFIAFQQLVKDAQDIADGRGPELIPPPRPVSNASSLSRKRPDKYRVLRTVPWDMDAGSLISDATARFLLSQKPKLHNARGELEQYSVQWADLIFQTFTSADVFPHFYQFYGEQTIKLTANELYTILNKTAKENVPRNVFEAFLRYCQHFHELFVLDDETNGLKVTTSGWEYCREHGVWGLPRKIVPRHLVKPQGLNQAEYLMTEYVKKHGLLGRKEKFYRSTVLEWLKKNIDSKITEYLVEEYLDYWSLVGTFFVYSDPRELSQTRAKQRIHCIDNGWDPELYSSRLRVECYVPYSSILPILKVFQNIKGDISTKDLRVFYRGYKERGEKVTPTALFNYVYGTKSQRTEGMNWSVSRQEFELFLRWEHRSSDWYKFVLYYNDEVELVEQAVQLR